MNTPPITIAIRNPSEDDLGSSAERRVISLESSVDLEEEMEPREFVSVVRSWLTPYVVELNRTATCLILECQSSGSVYQVRATSGTGSGFCQGSPHLHEGRRICLVVKLHDGVRISSHLDVEFRGGSLSQYVASDRFAGDAALSRHLLTDLLEMLSMDETDPGTIPVGFTGG